MVREVASVEVGIDLLQPFGIGIGPVDKARESRRELVEVRVHRPVAVCSRGLFRPSEEDMVEPVYLRCQVLRGFAEAGVIYRRGLHGIHDGIDDGVYLRMSGAGQEEQQP